MANLHSYCNLQIESLMYIEANASDNETIQYMRERIDEDKHKQGDHSGKKAESRPLFASNCKSSFFVLGNRPSNANYFLEQKDVQYLLQEMALKT